MGKPSLGKFGAKYKPVPSTAWQVSKAARALPPKVLDLYALMRNQGSIGSCTGFGTYAIASILSGIGLIPSPLALYYYNRVESNLPTGEDTGAYLEASMRALVKYGVGSESLWPYDVSKFAIEPPDDYQAQAHDHRIGHYYRARTVERARTALANGLPILVGFDVPGDFAEVGATGEWQDDGGPSLGRHAVTIVGYDDDHNLGSFLMQNSWGKDWGTSHPFMAEHEGYFWVPYDAYEYGRRFFDALVGTTLDMAA